MSKLTFYTDGSQVKVNNKTRQGWGVVARHIAGNTIEINGFVEHQNSQEQKNGFFELLAFYHAVLHAEENGITPEETSFYTDCSWVAYAGYHLVRENRSGQRFNIFYRLKRFQRLFCPNDKHAVIKLIRWLGLSQVHWVKGHKRIIDNCRADYLARQAVNKKEAQPFSKWIMHGFSVWDNTIQGMTHWFPAFSKTEEVKHPEPYTTKNVTFKWDTVSKKWQLI